jgi:RimJ/RimL family protein N-acetyltransferase
MQVDVREATKQDFELITDYFHSADHAFLMAMGVDQEKLPSRVSWTQKLEQELQKPYRAKKLYYIIWEESSVPIGHSNISDIVYGDSAKMHLHIWEKDFRMKDIGQYLIRKSISLYFKNIGLSQIVCEPISTNKAPNKTLLKIGFPLEKTYETIPGHFNYLQEVNRYVLHKTEYEKNIICI